MPKSSRHKLKLLYVKEILERESDAKNPITVEQICEKLAVRGIEAERKSIYDDLVALGEFGVQIVKVRRDKTTKYYAETRLLDLPELKLLVDAVQSSRFITKAKSDTLIQKLSAFVSARDARTLSRQVYTTNRIKAQNETVYETVDMLHEAIAEDKQVSFQYFSWNLKKEKVLHRDGAFYTVSPWALIWNDEYYYLVAYDPQKSSVRHYRVDKMLNMQKQDIFREGKAFLNMEDPAVYSQRMFGMFGGEEILVTLRCANSLIDVILDRFGTGVSIYPAGEDIFEVTTRVAISPNFLAWVIGFGARMRVVQPQAVADRVAELARAAL